MNDNRCQFIKVQSVAYCETYGCTRRAAWAIGKPDGPQVKRHNLCDGCARDLIEGMPEDLLVHLTPPPAAIPLFDPGAAVSPVALRVDPDTITPPDGILIDPLNVELEEIRNTGMAPPVGSASPKIYTCSQCGEVFYNHSARDRHRKNCKGPVPDKKGGRKK